MPERAGLIPLLAAGLSAVLAGLIARWGPIDAPDPRRSHLRPTPTSGGLAIMAGVGAGLAALAWSHLVDDPRLGGLMLLAAAAGLLGAADDVFDFGAGAKLGLQAGLALAFAVGVARVGALPVTVGLGLPLGPALGAAGTALWIVVLTNAVNFMDGADGLAPGAAIIAFVSLALAAAVRGQDGLAWTALAAAAAGLGFLPWNFPAHRLFQGDAGSLFSGFLLAGLAVLATAPAHGQPLSPYPVVFAALPMLTDVLLTLLTRARARKPLSEAHREHLYQRWLDATGAGHPALALRFWVITLGFAALGLAAEETRAPALWLIAAVIAASLGWIYLRRRITPAG